METHPNYEILKIASPEKIKRNKKSAEKTKRNGKSVDKGFKVILSDTIENYSKIDAV